MKRQFRKVPILSSTYNSSLVLAKGIYVPSYFMPESLQDMYSDYLVGGYNEAAFGYLFFTEATYDVATQSIKGTLLNHEELVRKYHLQDISNKNMTYFRVDLNANRTGTELTTSGMENYKLTEYLSSMFDVENNAPNLQDSWISIDSPEFQTEYQDALHRCRDYIISLKRPSEASNYRKECFAACFAVIDPKLRLGVVGENADGTIFTANSYEQYIQKINEMARELGKSSSKELQFKTFYFGSPLSDEDGPGTEYTLTQQAYKICKRLNQLYKDELYASLNDFGDIEIDQVTTGVQAEVTIDPYKLDTEIEKHGNSYAHIYIPEDTSANEACELIHDTLNELT